MDSSFFSGRHGPCPFCQGADRYRWSKKYGGVWICNFCTAGRYKGGFEMLMRHMAYFTFAEAANHVRDHFRAGGQAPVKLRNARATSRANDLDQHKRNLERMREIWSKCEPIMSNDPVDLYLQRRVPGLDFVPDMVRFHPNLDYWAPPANDGGKPVLLGRFPAMVAKAFDAEGRFVQLHKTYLTPEGNKADVPVVKKTERGIGINGFAVPIAPIKGDTLGVAEGIETALAASMFRGIPVWPCLNGPSMAAFSVPSKLLETVQRVVIFADHDALTTRIDAGGSTVYRRPGSDYAEQLAARVRSQGKRVMVIKACRVGQDMVDQWREYNQRSAAGVAVRAPAGRVRAAQPASASV